MNEFQILVFLGLPDIGRVSTKKIIDSTVKIDNLTDPQDFMEIVNFILPKIGKKLLIDHYHNSIQQAHDIISNCLEFGIQIISCLNEKYPKILNDIGKDAPVLLYAKGDLNSFNQKNKVAVIGTRNISPYGVVAGEYLTKYLIEKEVVIVSGLATGCDTIAHQTCINFGGVTIAVLPSGINNIFPKENEKLAENILINGCIISEYPPNTHATTGTFIERDRIQAGLSDGIVVIETDVKGGSIHTVNYGIKYNKQIGCLSYKEENQHPSNLGNKKLIIENKAFGITSKNIEEFLIKIKNINHK